MYNDGELICCEMHVLFVLNVINEPQTAVTFYPNTSKHDYFIYKL